MYELENDCFCFLPDSRLFYISSQLVFISPYTTSIFHYFSDKSVFYLLMDNNCFLFLHWQNLDFIPPQSTEIMISSQTIAFNALIPRRCLFSVTPREEMFLLHYKHRLLFIFQRQQLFFFSTQTTTAFYFLRYLFFDFL